MKTQRSYSKARSADALTSYLRGLRDCPPLSREEEVELANEYQNEGNSSAGDRLVRANLRAVVKIASRYQRPDVGLLELIQEGNLGLLQAVRRFNPDRGVRLVTYASWWIRAYVQRYLQERLPHMSAGAMNDMVGYMSLEPGDVRRRRSIPVREISIDQPMGDDAGQPLSAMLADDTPNQETRMMDHERAAVRSRWVRRQLNTLDMQEQQVISWRYLRERPRTLKEIGAELGLSRQHIHQIEQKARRKLGEALMSDSAMLSA